MKRKDREMIKDMKSSLSEKAAAKIREEKRLKAREEKKARRKRSLLVLAGIIIVALIVTGIIMLANRPKTTPDTIPEPEVEAKIRDTTAIITPKGTIQIQLLPNMAPETVKNFKKVASEGHYINSFFHRIVKDDSLECAINPDSPQRPGFDSTMPIETSPVSGETYTLSTVIQPGTVNEMKTGFFKINKGMPTDGGTVFGKVVAGHEFIDEMMNMPVVNHIEDNNYDVNSTEISFPENPDDLRIFDISFQ